MNTAPKFAYALIGLFALNATAAPTPPPPRPHVDTSHGVVIPDEYRWMETAGKAIDPWIDAEDAQARATLDALPGRAALQDRITELWRTGSGDVNEDFIDARGGKTLVMDYSLDRPRLAVRASDPSLRILFDGQSDGPDKGASVRRAATRLSPDGRYLTVGLVERGDARPRLRIMDVSTGRWLPETLSQPLWADADGFYIAWLPDSRHLLWVRNPTRTASTPEGAREFDGHVYLHRLKTPQEQDVALFGRSMQPELASSDTPYPAVSSDGKWAVVRVRSAASRALWVAPLKDGQPTAPFREIIAARMIAGWGIRGDSLWALIPDGAPRNRLVRIRLDAAEGRAETVLEGDTGVLAHLAVAADAIYLGQRDGAISSLWRLLADGSRQPIALPRSGVVSDFAVGADGRGVRLLLESALHPGQQLTVAEDAMQALPASPPPTGLPTELDQLSVSVVHAPARDGVLVPVSLLHRRDLKRDGKGFVRMDAYGCFGTSTELAYDPATIAWIERGGIIAVAHVRGGSEYGSEWHEANVARGHATASEDVVDIVEHLVRERWVAPGRAALVGSSCGAATVGNAALSRPDLIAAASLHVGGVDEWRAWSETASGARSVRDIGDPETALGVRRIVAASPYHRLLPGVRQPALFLFNGGNDYTIPLWMGAKFVARARAKAGVGSGPLLFRVDRDAGHNGPATFEAQVRVHTDDLAFQLWQLGHPDFQPSKKSDPESRRKLGSKTRRLELSASQDHRGSQ